MNSIDSEIEETNLIKKVGEWNNAAVKRFSFGARLESWFLLYVYNSGGRTFG